MDGSAPSAHTPGPRLWPRFANLLFASFGFLLLRFLLGPIRIKLLTWLLAPSAYGSISLIGITISLVAMVSSVGSFEYLLLRCSGRPAEVQQGMYKTIMLCFGGLAVPLALAGMGVLAVWPPSGFRLSPLDTAACGLLLVLTVLLLQRTNYLLGIAHYSRSRLTVLLYADLWFLPVLLLAGRGRGALSISLVLWVWAGWTLLAWALTNGWVRLREVWARPATRAGLRDVLLFGVPLIPMILGDWLMRVQDRYVILAFRDVALVGGYSLCMSIAMIGVQTGDVLLDILSTDFFRIRNRIDSHDLRVLTGHYELRARFTLMVRYCTAIAFLFAAAAFFLPEAILRFISGQPEYMKFASILPWASGYVFFFLLYIIFGRMLIALGLNKVFGWSTLAAAGLNLALNLLLVRWMGGPGAALAATLSIGMLVVYMGARLQVWRWLEWPELKAGRLLLLLGGAGAWFWFLARHWPHAALLPLLLAGGGGLGLIAAASLVHKNDFLLLLSSFSDAQEAQTLPAENAQIENEFSADRPG